MMQSAYRPKLLAQVTGIAYTNFVSFFWPTLYINLNGPSLSHSVDIR